jgi:hypothetical protein
LTQTTHFQADNYFDCIGWTTDRHCKPTLKKKLKHPTAQKMNFFGYPHCTHLVAAPPLNPKQCSHQKSAIFAAHNFNFE